MIQEKRAGLKTTEHPPKQTSNEPATVAKLEDVLDKQSEEDKIGPNDDEGKQEEEDGYEDDQFERDDEQSKQEGG